MNRNQFLFRQGLMIEFYLNIRKHGRIIYDNEYANKRTLIIEYKGEEYTVSIRAGYISTLTKNNKLNATLKKSYYIINKYKRKHPKNSID